MTTKEHPAPTERLRANLQRTTIPGLDGIRGIASLSVVVFHGWSQRAPGRFAVEIFFVISGLLITWLMLREQQHDKYVDRHAFYMRRALRLFPALMGLLVWQWVTGIPTASHGAMIATALYVANYYSLLGGNLDGLGQCWSLAVEEHFYLVWPQVFAVIRNHRTLLLLCIVATTASLIWRFIAGYQHRFYAELSTETTVNAILVGSASALVLYHTPEKLPNIVFWPPLAPLSVLGIIGLAQLPRMSQLWWGVPLGIPFALIIVLQSITYEWWILENPIARYLGRISYGIYLWGMVAIELAGRLAHHIALRGVGLLTMLATAVVLATLSRILIERPIQSFGRRTILQSKTVLDPA